MLTDEHKQKCLAAALLFLDHHHREGDEFLVHIVTVDETWVPHYAPGSKQHSQGWHHAHSPMKKKT
jgi:hypothetical protein